MRQLLFSAYLLHKGSTQANLEAISTGTFSFPLTYENPYFHTLVSTAFQYKYLHSHLLCAADVFLINRENPVPMYSHGNVINWMKKPFLAEFAYCDKKRFEPLKPASVFGKETIFMTWTTILSVCSSSHYILLLFIFYTILGFKVVNVDDLSPRSKIFFCTLSHWKN